MSEKDGVATWGWRIAAIVSLFGTGFLIANAMSSVGGDVDGIPIRLISQHEEIHYFYSKGLSDPTKPIPVVT